MPTGKDRLQVYYKACSLTVARGSFDEAKMTRRREWQRRLANQPSGACATYGEAAVFFSQRLHLRDHRRRPDALMESLPWAPPGIVP